MTAASKMSSSSPTDSVPPQRTAFCSIGQQSQTNITPSTPNHWQALSVTSLPLDDLGSLQGATLVERLRTINGRPLDLELHLGRLKDSAEVLGIAWPVYLTADLVNECVDRNRPAHKQIDFAVVILLTPGLAHAKSVGQQPTVLVHTTDLHWPQLAHWYQHGQPLVTADNRNVPAACWSPHIKTRSRLHYFLADQTATASGLPYAGAAMLSCDGWLTESSVANLLMIQGDSLLSPPIDSVLHGLSLRRTLRLASAVGVEVRFAHLSTEAARQSAGLLLTGSSGCLWAASQLDDVQFESPLENSLFKVLRDAWIADLELDYVDQALRNVQCSK